MKLPNDLKTERVSAFTVHNKSLFLPEEYEIADEIYTHFGKRIAIFTSPMGTGLADDTWQAFKNAEKKYRNVWVRSVRYAKRDLERVTK